jgi:hypothetical protein
VIVSTLAGSGVEGASDTVGTAASFYEPSGVVVDASGNVYVGDSRNNKIRKITQSPTGLLENSYAEGGLSVFPNPNNGVFTISLSKEETFSLMNNLGQIVQTIALIPSNNYTATISGLENGIYFLKGHTANYQNTKIVVGK